MKIVFGRERELGIRLGSDDPLDQLWLDVDADGADDGAGPSADSFALTQPGGAGHVVLGRGPLDPHSCQETQVERGADSHAAKGVSGSPSPWGG